MLNFIKVMIGYIASGFSSLNNLLKEMWRYLVGHTMLVFLPIAIMVGFATKAIFRQLNLLLNYAQSHNLNVAATGDPAAMVQPLGVTILGFVDVFFPLEVALACLIFLVQMGAALRLYRWIKSVVPSIAN